MGSCLKKLIQHSLLSFALLIPFLNHAATQPKFDMIPTTATTIQIPSNESATVQYQVTNRTRITRTLVMKPIQGIRQITITGCKNPFTLEPNASCFLTLQLDGSTLFPRIMGGPIVCKTRSADSQTPDPFLCSQPAETNSLNITVIPPIATLTRIIVAPPTASIANGTSQQLTAIGVYSNGTTRNITNTVSWSSANTTIATVSNTFGSKGLAQAQNPGTTTVSANLNGLSGSATLMVKPNTVVLTAIEVTPSNASVVNNTTQQFTATGIFSDGSRQNITTDVVWSSSNISIATISNTAGSQGLATAISIGSTTVTATRGVISGSTPMTVIAPTLVSISVTPTNPTIINNTTQQFTATGIYSNNVTQDITKIVTWTSSTAVASISNDQGSQGLATALSTGTTTITARLGSISGSTGLTVTTASIVSIAVAPANPSVAAGTTVQLTAIATLSNGNTYDVTSIASWASANTSIATVSNDPANSGLVTGITAGGPVAISATLTGISGSTSVTVTNALLTSIAVVPSPYDLPNGDTLQYTATGTYSDASEQNITNLVLWASSNTNLATISNASGSEGLAQAAPIGTGATLITASLDGITSPAATLNITNPTLVSISVDPANYSMLTGQTVQYIATGAYNNGNIVNLTAVAVWASSNTNVATISNSSSTKGLATGVTPGQTTISATYKGITGSTALTISNTLSNYAFIPNNGNNKVSICPISGSVYFGSCQYSVTTFSQPRKGQVNATLDHIYITNFGNDTVSVCTLPSGSVPQLDDCTTTAAPVQQPIGTALYTGLPTKYIYFANSSTSSITVCEELNGTLGPCNPSNIPGITPTDIVVSSNDAISPFLYVSDTAANKIYACPIQMNGTLGVCVDMGMSGSLDGPTGLALRTGGTQLYINNATSDKTMICNISSNGQSLFSCNDATGSSGIPLFSNPLGIYQIGSTTYVVSNGDNKVYNCTANTSGSLLDCIDTQGTGVGVAFTSPQYINLNVLG